MGLEAMEKMSLAHPQTAATLQCYGTTQACPLAILSLLQPGARFLCDDHSANYLRDKLYSPARALRP